jgi:hypothetical protein
MSVQNPKAPESAQFDETMRPANATGARRHRPSSKAVVNDVLPKEPKRGGRNGRGRG